MSQNPPGSPYIERIDLPERWAHNPELTRLIARVAELEAERDGYKADSLRLHKDKMDAIDARIAAESKVVELEGKNRQLGQLLAHIHLHLTNDEDFGIDEMESDMKKAGEGRWIDTESILIDERNARAAAERERDEARREIERLRGEVAAVAKEGWDRALESVAVALAEVGLHDTAASVRSFIGRWTPAVAPAQEGGND